MPERGERRPNPGAAPNTASSTTGSREPTGQVRQVAAARRLADRAKRLSLRAAGTGRVDTDDLLDVVRCTGALVDEMLGQAVDVDPLDAVRAAGIPVPTRSPAVTP